MERLQQNYTIAFTNSITHLQPRGLLTIHQKVFFFLGLVQCAFLLYRLWERYTESVKSKGTDECEKDLSTIIVDIEKIPTEPKPKQQSLPSVTDYEAMKSVLMLFLVLSYYFFCDYVHVFPRGPRLYNRDLFMFLLALLFIVNIVYTSKVSNTSDKLLNRDQTEEWKGWMQVMFVWYHYYAAKETYNLIRLFIASYVWMTGFGNFSFYWVKKDYSLRRIFNSLFRLNFLVLLTCMVTNNSYMLYYICAMHTFWYLSVYAMMRPFYQYNENPKVMGSKLLIYFITVFVIFDINGLSTWLFTPLGFILNYKNSIHEWVFRSTLDHYATFVGMVSAYFHPNVEAVLRRINSHSHNRILVGAILCFFFIVDYVWYKNVFVLNKYDYNKLHPYTFFIPMFTYIFVRNCTESLRKWHCTLFGYLGKITLETYISQLHIYLIQDAKGILVFFPNYPLINFLVNTMIYVMSSHVLFHATVTLNSYIFPSDRKKIWKNIISIALGILTAYLFMFIVDCI